MQKIADLRGIRCSLSSHPSWSGISRSHFVSIGALCAVLCFAPNQPDRIETEAVITDFDRDGFPYVEYTVGGRSYETRLNYSSSTMREGDTVTVRYDSENPRDVQAGFSVFFILACVFAGIGILFTALGVVFLCLAGKARRMKIPEWERPL